MANNVDRKLDTKQSSPNLKVDTEVDYAIAPAGPHHANLAGSGVEELELVPKPGIRPASGTVLTIEDLNFKFVTRLNLFALATGLLVVAGNVNKLLETIMGEQLINSIMPLFLTFALLEVVIVFSSFLVLCHLAFSTIGVNFYEDRKRYVRWVRIFEITIFKRTTSIPGSAKVYIDGKKLLGLRYHVIRVNQDGPIIIRRFSHNDCLQIGQRIAEFLQLDLDDQSHSK